jgi:methylglutaconyl-CoA hydratase
MRRVTRAFCFSRLSSYNYTSSTSGSGVDCVLKMLDGQHEGIALMTLSRPQVKNALGKRLIQEMQEHISTLRSSKSCRVLIVNSSTTGIFCAGADLKERSTMSQDEVAPFVKQLRSTFTDLERLPFPVLAAVDGTALGGGLELAMAADLRITSESSQLGLPETKLAIIPAAGGTQRLPRLVGLSNAKDLIFTGKILNAKQAQSIGLVDYVCADGKAYEHALDLAATLLEKGKIIP